MIQIGLKNEIKIKVTASDTAKALGSGELEVLATPRMIALMEQTAYKCIAPYLDDGVSSVGTFIKASHLASTPVGMEIRAVCEVISSEDRKILFNIEAYDEKGLIGKAEHERFLVKSDKFIAKTYAKLDK